MATSTRSASATTKSTSSTKSTASTKASGSGVTIKTAENNTDSHDAQLLYFKSMSPEPTDTSNNGLYVCCRWTANKASREACGNYISHTSVKFCKNIHCQKPLCWYCPICNRVLTPTFRSRHNNDQHGILSPEIASTSKSKRNVTSTYHPYQHSAQKVKKEGKLVSQTQLSNKALNQLQEDVVPKKEIQQMVTQGSGNYTQPTDTWVPNLLSITPQAVPWVCDKVENLVLVAKNIPQDITLQCFKSAEEEIPEGDLPISGRFTNSANVKAEDLHTIFSTITHPIVPSSLYIAVCSSTNKISNKLELQFTSPPVNEGSEVSSGLGNIQNVDPGFFEEVETILQLDSQAQVEAWDGSYTDLLTSFSKGLTEYDFDGIALLVAAVLGSNERHCVALCLIFRFVCLGWYDEDLFGQLLGFCTTNPEISADDLVTEINKGVSIVNFSDVIEAIVTHIKSIATLYGGHDYYSNETVSSEDATICDTAPENIVCSICQELLKDPVTAPCCKQLFCTACIATWLTEDEEENENSSCPLCRTHITLESCTRATQIEKQKIYIKCAHCAGQFHWTIFSSHVENCGAAPVRCKWECGNEGLTKEKKIAHELWCAEQIRQCMYCDATMRQDVLVQHLKSACLLAPPEPAPQPTQNAKGKDAEKVPQDAKGKEKPGLFSQLTTLGSSLFGKLLPVSPSSVPELLPGSIYQDYDSASDVSLNSAIWKRKVEQKVKKSPLSQDVEEAIVLSLNISKMSEWLKYQSLKSDTAKVIDCKLLFGIYDTNDPKWKTWKSQWNSTPLLSPETHPFGNVHTVALQIGCAVISWLPSSLVKVDRMIPENTVLALRLDDLAPAPLNEDSVYDNVARVIVKWNASRKYNLRECNPQLFVKDLISNGLGIYGLDIPPIFEEYLEIKRQNKPAGDLLSKLEAKAEPGKMSQEQMLQRAIVPT